MRLCIKLNTNFACKVRELSRNNGCGPLSYTDTLDAPWAQWRVTSIMCYITKNSVLIPRSIFYVL